jgi:pyruvate carboxylase
MFSGSLGVPDGGWPRDIQDIVLKGKAPTPGRPGEHLPPVDLEKTAATLKESTGQDVSHTDLLSYLMYPEVFLAFDKVRQAYMDVSVLPTPQFFYGMERGDEIALDIEPGKTLIIKFLTVSEPHPEGTRTIFFELNGQPREVVVADRSLNMTVQERAKADPSKPGHVGAPIPGAVTSLMVGVGDQVKSGDRLLVMEAMKMQTTVYAPVAGQVIETLVSVGQTVDAKDLLLVLE